MLVHVSEAASELSEAEVARACRDAWSAAASSTELKDKAVGLVGDFAAPPAPASAAPLPAGGEGDANGVAADAVSALVNLGYGRAEAFGAVNRAVQGAGGGKDLDALIPAALKELSQ